MVRIFPEERKHNRVTKGAGDSITSLSLAFLQRLLADFHPRDFSVRLWDGTTWDAEPGQSALYTLVIPHPGSLRKMFLRPSELALGEAYIHNDFDIEGEIEFAFSMADHLFSRRFTLGERLRHAGFLIGLPVQRSSSSTTRTVRLTGAPHSKKRDRQAVTFHYNVSNDFYALWLDNSMAYSCAYFRGEDDDLDTAQERKLDYICRKLRLRPGERLLDIGCGWGGPDNSCRRQIRSESPWHHAERPAG